jgi:hypothetical protein
MRWFMTENSTPLGSIPMEEWCAADLQYLVTRDEDRPGIRSPKNRGILVRTVVAFPEAEDMRDDPRNVFGRIITTFIYSVQKPYCNLIRSVQFFLFNAWFPRGDIKV